MKVLASFSFRIIATLICIAPLLLTHCTKKEKILYGALKVIDGLEILDIESFQDSLLIITGKKDDNKGYIYVYNTSSTKITATQTKHVMYDIFVEDSKLWACGDSMSLLTSIDTGATWKVRADFSYFWEADKSDFRQVFVRNNQPIFAIGSQDMLNGNMYIKNNSTIYPFLSIQMQAGVNDMVVIDSSQVYVATYGSIVRFKNDGAVKQYQNVGGHNFTSIAFSGTKTVYSTTYDGTIFSCETTDSVWKKVVDTRFELRHIAADSYGNVLAIGKSNTVYISNDFGENWRVEKYANGRDVTSLTCINGIYYIGSKSGEIHTITRKQLE